MVKVVEPKVVAKQPVGGSLQGVTPRKKSVRFSDCEPSGQLCSVLYFHPHAGIGETAEAEIQPNVPELGTCEDSGLKDLPISGLFRIIDLTRQRHKKNPKFLDESKVFVAAKRNKYAESSTQTKRCKYKETSSQTDALGTCPARESSGTGGTAELDTSLDQSDAGSFLHEEDDMDFVPKPPASFSSVEMACSESDLAPSMRSSKESSAQQYFISSSDDEWSEAATQIETGERTLPKREDSSAQTYAVSSDYVRTEASAQTENTQCSFTREDSSVQTDGLASDSQVPDHPARAECSPREEVTKDSLREAEPLRCITNEAIATSEKILSEVCPAEGNVIRDKCSIEDVVLRVEVSTQTNFAMLSIPDDAAMQKENVEPCLHSPWKAPLSWSEDRASACKHGMLGFCYQCASAVKYLSPAFHGAVGDAYMSPVIPWAASYEALSAPPFTPCSPSRLVCNADNSETFPLTPSGPVTPCSLHAVCDIDHFEAFPLTPRTPQSLIHEVSDPDLVEALKAEDVTVFKTSRTWEEIDEETRNCSPEPVTVMSPSRRIAVQLQNRVTNGQSKSISFCQARQPACSPSFTKSMMHGEEVLPGPPQEEDCSGGLVWDIPLEHVSREPSILSDHSIDSYQAIHLKRVSGVSTLQSHIAAM
jgi:hypothetical protein